jgi:hypothetical protein
LDKKIGALEQDFQVTELVLHDTGILQQSFAAQLVTLPLVPLNASSSNGDASTPSAPSALLKLSSSASSNHSVSLQPASTSSATSSNPHLVKLEQRVKNGLRTRLRFLEYWLMNSELHLNLAQLQWMWQHLYQQARFDSERECVMDFMQKAIRVKPKYV